MEFKTSNQLLDERKRYHDTVFNTILRCTFIFIISVEFNLKKLYFLM